MTRIAIRSLEADDISPLAVVWHDAWHRAHADFVPAGLTALRTIREFTDRLNANGDRVFVTGPIGQPSGLCMVRDDKLSQLFVSQRAQGTGAAVALINEGERRIAQLGHAEAWLDCVKENVRALRFYERQGWKISGTTTAQLDTSDGKFALETLILRKRMEIKTS